MLNFIKGFAAHKAVKAVAGTPDKQTTLLGAVAAGVLAVNIDYTKLIQGDHTEVAKALGAVGMGLFGYLTNKSQAPGPQPAAPPTDGK